MLALAREQPGFLGAESARGMDGLGITVSYWDSPEAIAAWRAHPEHALVQAAGRERWYRHYRVRVCRVEREYGSDAG
jgi:heme-degrading monooxygenase HmoA